MKKLLIISTTLTAFLLALLVSPVGAQTGDFGIRLRKDFGYNAGINVRGTFSIILIGDEHLVSVVEFLIDGELLAVVEEAPYRFQFHTDSFGHDVHRLSARVFLLDGSTIETPPVQYNFLSQKAERSQLVVLFGGIGMILLLSFVIYGLVQLLLRKGKPKHVENSEKKPSYGALGGTICPKCKLPFPRHIWGLNLGVGKLDRCEHCGKWSITRRATLAELKAAEKTQQKKTEVTVNQAEKGVETYQRTNKKTIEDTRYIDSL